MSEGVREVRNSRRSRRPAAVAGAAMLLVLAAGVLLSAANPALFTSPGRIPLLDGRWASGYEGRYEKELPLQRPAAAVWDLLRYKVFGEGVHGVLVGEDGWLFTIEEFEAAAGGGPSFAEQVDRIADARRELEARGVRLVVALVPAKARVYPEHLGRYTVPPALRGRYEAVRRELSGRGITVPDLFGPLRQAAPLRPVFLRTDTHWTPYGARVAAEAAAPAVAADLQRAGSPRAAFLSEAAGPREHRGDLLRFIRLGPWLKRFGPPPDTVVPIDARAGEGGGPGLFGELVIPVVLVGTSYSAGPLWSFEDALKTALQADVLNVAEEGRGPFAPMRDLLEGTVLEDVGADVVIWEIPERYFNFPP
jgi:alginate O-acetyltransferase complex protein AlgJ